MNKKEAAFIRKVKKFYADQGRFLLPWRKTTNPYKILVSEVMLQQTQVDRVLPKYTAFIKTFPSVQRLASATLGEVLITWQGLGYNRRAKMLHACAREVVHTYKGVFPHTREALEALPGVGPYTAGAILAFAFNIPTVLIETNIRAVFLHHFYNDATDVSDAQLLQHIKATLNRDNPREWYWALMDYGSYIKKMYGNPNVRSKHYTRQSPFAGSTRQLRGSIITLLSQKAYTRHALHRMLSSFEDALVDATLQTLLHEKMIMQKGRSYTLP